MTMLLYSHLESTHFRPPLSN